MKVCTLAPKMIKQTMSQINQIAQRRIQQVINQGGEQVKKITPKKNNSRLLGTFSKKADA